MRYFSLIQHTCLIYNLSKILKTIGITYTQFLKLCIKSNKNIFIEKPGLKSYADLKKIKKLNHKKILMFGYIYVFNNNIKFIKKYVSSNKNGKILYMKFQRQNLGPIRSDVNAAYDLSSHDLSIFLYIFNKLPKLIKNSSYSILKRCLILAY